MSGREYLDPVEVQGMVRSIAFRLRAQLSLRVDVEELVQMGNVGLLEALDRYDPKSGVAVATYVYHRIRGAMLDGARVATGVTRGQIRALKRLQSADTFAESHAHAASEQSDVDYVSAAVRGVTFVSDFAQVCEESMSAANDGDTPWSSAPDRLAMRAQLRAVIESVLDELGAEEATLLRRHYIDGVTLAELGEQVGVSRSWASRVHTRALARARQLLQERHRIDLTVLSEEF